MQGAAISPYDENCRGKTYEKRVADICKIEAVKVQAWARIVAAAAGVGV